MNIKQLSNIYLKLMDLGASYTSDNMLLGSLSSKRNKFNSEFNFKLNLNLSFSFKLKTTIHIMLHTLRVQCS